MSKIAKAIEEKIEQIDFKVLRASELEAGDVLVIRCPGKYLNQVGAMLEKLFKPRGIQVFLAPIEEPLKMSIVRGTKDGSETEEVTPDGIS